MPLFNLFGTKEDELAHERLVAKKGFEEAFVKGNEAKPIVIKQDGKEAKSCYDVCPNSGACDKCDGRF